MADTWDDSDDDAWDASDDEIEARLNNLNTKDEAPKFDDEEDLAVKERAAQEELKKTQLKAKGSALAAKKAAEQARKEEEEIARQVLKMEAEMEANMTPEERRKLERQRVEEADHALTDDLFGAVEAASGKGQVAVSAGDKVVMKDLKDHLKHARQIGTCVKDHGKAHLTIAFLKEVVQQCKEVIGDDEISELIKCCNVIKNDKVLAAKKKVKGQAQKAKKDKAAEAKAKKIQQEMFGESDTYDQYDAYGDAYEDDFF